MNKHRTSWQKLLALTAPVMMGYVPLGIAFGLLAVQMGLPFWVPVLMSVLIYSGTNQFLLLSLWGASASLPYSLVAIGFLSVRHVFYGLSLPGYRFANAWQKHYSIYALTDETFSLLTALPAHQGQANVARIAFLNQSYWLLGTVIGALAGQELPFVIDGLPFALTALFIVLLVEQFHQLRRARYFVQAFIVGLLCLWLIPQQHFLLASISMCLVLVGSDFYRNKRHEQ